MGLIATGKVTVKVAIPDAVVRAIWKYILGGSDCTLLSILYSGLLG